MQERNNNLLTNARALRKEMTPQENRLWYQFLRKYPLKFYRQKIIGNYIADFYCDKAKLIVEADGSQHYDPSVIRYDQIRTEYLNGLGMEVLRFPNNEINAHFQSVCSMIHDRICERVGYDPFNPN